MPFMRDALLDVTMEAEGEVVVASISGQVDGSNAAELGTALAGRVPNSVLGLVLDCSATDYFDSAGIQFLFDLAERLRTRRQRLVLVIPEGARIRATFELAGVGETAPIESSQERAIQALSG
jgi:anti-anti-sigma factor